MIYPFTLNLTLVKLQGRAAIWFRTANVALCQFQPK